MIPEGVLLAGFVVWCIAAALYILDTLIHILTRSGGDE